MKMCGFVRCMSSIKVCKIQAFLLSYATRRHREMPAFVFGFMAAALLHCTPLNASIVSNATTGVGYPTLRAGLQEVASNQHLVLSADTFTEGGLVITNDWVTLSGQGRNLTRVQAAPATGAATTGVFVVRGNHVVIERMTIRYGQSPDNGGGVCNASNGTVVVQDCEVANNMAAADGGGVYNCVLSRSEVWGCRATSSGGGACGGALSNCAVWGNSAWLGGGSCDSALVNCTLTGNRGVEAGGGALRGTAVNCILWDNAVLSQIDPDWCGEAAGIRYSCAPGLAGTGNIGVNPRFVDAPGGDYHLAPESPCVDAGMDLSGKGVTCDIEGRPRPLDGNHDFNHILAYDMGAYERGVPGGLPAITTANPLPDGKVDEAYSQTLTVEGSLEHIQIDPVTGIFYILPGHPESYVWSVAEGDLPSGLTLSPTNGLLAGTPAETTVANFRVRVTDSEFFYAQCYAEYDPVTAIFYAERYYVLTVVAGPVRADLAYAFTNFVGQAEYMGSDDGTGTNAWFAQPSGVAVDSAGNLYVADTGNSTIRKVTPAGVVTTLAGTAYFAGAADGTGGEAQFFNPCGVAADGAGNVYVADTWNNTVRKITPNGAVTTLAGSPGFSGSADGTGRAARFNGPSGVAVDHAGNVYVADTWNNSVRKVTPWGAVTTLAGCSDGLFGGGDPDGIGTNAWFSQPYGLALDREDNLYVTDSGNCTIRRVTPAGQVTTLAGRTGYYGSTDGTGNVARFSQPCGLTIDGAGCLYVADTGYNTIRKITPAGVVTTLGGLAGAYGSADGIGSLARFSQPYGIAIDSAKRLFVADSSNNRITRGTPFYPPPTITTPGLLPKAKSERTCHLPLTAVGGTSPYTWDLVSGSLPSGLNLGGDGVISGTPVSPTNVSFTVRVTGGDGLFSSQTFSLTVVLPDAPTILTLSPLTAGVVGTDYTLALSASAGTSPYMWSIASGAFPTGLTMSASGVIRGTPHAATVNTIRLRVTGADGLYSERDYSLTVAEDDALNTARYSWKNFVGLPGSYGTADGVGTNASFNNPVGVAADGEGNIYVADLSVCAIRKVTPAGVVSTLAGSSDNYGSADGTGAEAQFSQLCGIAADSGGNVYVADTANNTIRKVSPAGVVTTLAGDPSAATGSADGTGLAARFRYPQGVAVDSAGTVYVADTVNNTIRKVTSAGVVSTLAGAAGAWGYQDGTGTVARFWQPTGVAVDSAGDLYVADFGNTMIRKVTSAGVVTTLAGNMSGYTGTGYGNGDGLGNQAAFGQPSGVAVDARGNVYVADTLFYTIRKVTPAGQVTTIGGTATVSGSADGTGTVARFCGPSGVAVDSAGHVYVADMLNSRISKGSPIGLPPTIITPSPLPSGKRGVTYSLTFAAIDGTPPYTWACTSGGLPFELTLSGGGVISGTPAADTNANFTVRVTDGGGHSASKAFSLSIAGQPALSMLSGTDGLNLSWPSDCLGWELQRSTNLLNPALWVPVSGSTTSTLMSVTVDPEVPAAFYRLHRRD